ncbi:MAG: helix-turn-helix domain-containing protein [Chloroflexota bacterium]|nr:helix-turn-helix domain-containing protein [Chloroflexota bacterium]
MDISNLSLIGATEAARMLGITRPALDLLARQGKLPGVKVAQRWVFAKVAVEEFAKTYEGRPGRPWKKHEHD